MTKELTINHLPKPFIYTIKKDYYSDNSYVDTPYSSLENIEKTLKLYDIKVPFKVITHSDGISTCTYCKARYVGYQDRCYNLVTYYQEKGMWGFHRGDTFKGDYLNSRYESDRVVETKKDECKASCIWNLSDEFHKQRSFFNFISWLGDCSVDPLYNEYFSLIPKEKMNELRVNRLEQELAFTKRELSNVMGALQQIAEKMNQAGHSLIF